MAPLAATAAADRREAEAADPVGPGVAEYTASVPGWM